MAALMFTLGHTLNISAMCFRTLPAFQGKHVGKGMDPKLDGLARTYRRQHFELYHESSSVGSDSGIRWLLTCEQLDMLPLIHRFTLWLAAFMSGHAML